MSYSFNNVDARGSEPQHRPAVCVSDRKIISRKKLKLIKLKYKAEYILSRFNGLSQAHCTSRVCIYFENNNRGLYYHTAQNSGHHRLV